MAPGVGNSKQYVQPLGRNLMTPQMRASQSTARRLIYLFLIIGYTNKNGDSSSIHVPNHDDLP